MMTSAPISCVEGMTLPGRAAPFEGDCRWLISLDYDGTLRERVGPPIPAAFFELMAAWRSKGVRWGINTGRSLPYLVDDLLTCSPVMPDFVCTCERYVYLADGSGRVRPEHGHNDKCRADNEALRDEILPHVQAGFEALRRELPHLQWKVAGDDPLSVEATDAATMEQLAPGLAAIIAPLHGVAMERAGRYMRYSDARYSKGTALAHVAHSWRVPEENIFIMGDGHNDLGAFKLFPRAFCAAPLNVHPDIAAYLGDTGGHVSEKGVLEALHYWMSQR